MSQHEERYDSDTQTLWLLRRYDDPDTLVPRAELMAYGKAQREGADDSGRSITSVRYVFSAPATAEYTRDALAFMSLGVYTGSLDAPTPLQQDTPSFNAKEDFGI